MGPPFWFYGQPNAVIPAKAGVTDRSGSQPSSGSSMTSPRQRAVAEFVLDHLVWFMLAVVLIMFSLFVPNFFQIGIFANIVEQSTFVGVMAIGLAIVIIAGHMDLSVESTAALAAMVTGMLFCSRGIGMGLTLTPEWLVVPVSLLLALAVGGIIGFLNGLFTIKLKMNAFIVTLAGMLVFKGLALTVLGGGHPRGHGRPARASTVARSIGNGRIGPEGSIRAPMTAMPIRPIGVTNTRNATAMSHQLMCTSHGSGCSCAAMLLTTASQTSHCSAVSVANGTVSITWATRVDAGVGATSRGAAAMGGG